MKKIRLLLSIFALLTIVACNTSNKDEEKYTIIEDVSVDYTYKIEDLKVSFNAIGDIGKIKNYEWSFGDGEKSYTKNPIHDYSGYGKYKVTLKATTDDNKTQSVTKIVTVSSKSTSNEVEKPSDEDVDNDSDNSESGENKPAVTPKPIEITADFTFTVTDKTIKFTPIVENGEGYKLSYLWDFDNGAASSTEKSPVFRFSEGGKKYVTLKIFVDDNPTPVVNQLKIIDIADVINIFIHKKDGNEPELNPNYMYFALRLKGSSAGGHYRQKVVFGSSSDKEYGYPRGFEYMDKDSQNIKFPSKFVYEFAKLGVFISNYTDETGFANKEGTEFDMPFYFGVNNFRVKINKSKDSVPYTFVSLNVYDDVASGWGGGYALINFIRFNKSEAFTVNIPLKDYDEKIHKNIAKLTIDFTSNGYNYEPKITFDGYELKE